MSDNLNKDKVTELIINASLYRNCNDTIDDADNKSEAASKAASVLSTKDNYNDDDAKPYNKK